MTTWPTVELGNVPDLRSGTSADSGAGSSAHGDTSQRGRTDLAPEMVELIRMHSGEPEDDARTHVIRISAEDAHPKNHSMPFGAVP